ncbi:MAG: tetratricopeptide repeat protein [Candidatus Binataceae bacterium]
MRAFLAREPNNGRALLALGEVLAAQGHYADALAAYR